MRKLAATLSLIFCVSLFLLAQSPNDKDLLEKAKALYGQEDFITSVETLLRIEAKTAEVIYWLWQNEKKIGHLADPPSRDEDNSHHRYFQHAKNHPEHFQYCEACGGEYIPTNRRIEEIKSLFPQSEYVGTIVFEDIEENVSPMLSEGGLDEGGRVYLISQYQKFVNQYPQHPFVSEAQEQIEDLVRSPQKQLEKFGFVMANESMLMGYGRRFQIDEDKYKKYIDEWLKSGPYREFGIEVLEGRRDWMRFLNRFDIPKNTKKSLLVLLRSGKLVLFSEAAYKNEDWQGPKALVFDPKAN